MSRERDWLSHGAGVAYIGRMKPERPPEFEAWKTSPELARLARLYIWWKTPEEALRYPEQIIAQVMNLGDWDDVCRMVRSIGEEGLRRVIRHAEAGMFDAPSWHFWHYRLGLARLGEVPPLPARNHGNARIALRT